MNKKKLLLIQLNEINFELVRKYQNNIEFQFFNEDFFNKLSITNSEEKYELLEPWIQWVSVYTGKSATEHKIFRLGDIGKYSGELLFNAVEKLNKTIGIICSMNMINNFKKIKYFISDPWTNNHSGPGKKMNFISKTISQVVNLNSHKNISVTLYFKVLVILLISFRLKNIFLYLKLIFKFKKKWNKALLLDLILHDLHIDLLNKNKTEFSSIFFNAGAHIQHHYFFNSKHLENKVIQNPEWYIKKKYDPILDMIFFYDQILSEYKKLNEYDIILATGLSQKPYDRTKYYYRLKNHEKFLKDLNINFTKVEPRMTRDFLITFKNNIDKNQTIKKFYELNRINKETVFSFEDRNNSLFVTLSIQREIKKNDQILIDGQKKIMINDYVVFVALKNGMHDQKGYFYTTSDLKIDNIKEINQQIINFFTK
tara:strand:- start:4153 stop:5430 length:1278 start_codon:yes stop_codon:yes gene_type:complete